MTPGLGRLVLIYLISFWCDNRRAWRQGSSCAGVGRQERLQRALRVGRESRVGVLITCGVIIEVRGGATFLFVRPESDDVSSQVSRAEECLGLVIRGAWLDGGLDELPVRWFHA